MASKSSVTGAVFPIQPTMFQPGYSLVVTVGVSSCARVVPGVDPAQTTRATRIVATMARADRNLNAASLQDGEPSAFAPVRLQPLEANPRQILRHLPEPARDRLVVGLG